MEWHKYKVDLTIKGHIIITALSEAEAKEQADEGYSMGDVYFDDDEIDEVTQI